MADEELWGITGLLHDLDYERFPDMDDTTDGHPRTELRLFRERDYPPERSMPSRRMRRFGRPAKSNGQSAVGV